ncbi:MAG: hypothetical protein U0414_06595 [Polyangiaceae bacterium]
MKTLHRFATSISIAACGSLLVACDVGGGHPYAGTYEVPVPAGLESAATYKVDKVEWTVDGDAAELRYDLPLGLVGKSIGLSFKGSVAASGESASLTGSAGTAECTIAADEVVCNESMAGLLPLEPDYGVVEAHAATEYAGPVADRVDVAKRFAGDPIGIVHVDLTRAAPGAESN